MPGRPRHAPKGTASARPLELGPFRVPSDSHPIRPVLSWDQGRVELRMSSPSIIPNDRLDRDFYIVLEDFPAAPRSGRPMKGSIIRP